MSVAMMLHTALVSGGLIMMGNAIRVALRLTRPTLISVLLVVFVLLLW
jgi:hypothetical protein